MTRKPRRKGRQTDVRHLVRFALLSAAGGLAVVGVAVALRSQVDGILGGVLLVVATLGLLHAAMWAGGAAMFVFFDQLVTDAERTVRWYWGLLWLAGLLSIPIASYMLGFDETQWIFGTGSAVVGHIVVLLAYLPRSRSRP